MNPHETDRRHFERQIAYARPIAVLLALIALLQQPLSQHIPGVFTFLIVYFVVACGAILLERLISGRAWHLPLIVDLLALGYFIVVSPSMVPAWFPYLFVCYVAGNRWGLNSAFPLAGVLSLEIVLLTAVRGEMHWLRIVYWVGFVGATFAAGAGIAFLGDRNRLFAVQNEFFARITSTMEVDQGLSECLRLFLDELTHAFQAAEALLIYRDNDLERIFLWRLKSGESERLIPESLPMTRAEGLLLDDADATICWNSLTGAGSGFGWDRRDGRTLKTLPRLPGPTQQLLALRSMMSVTLDQSGGPAGRLFLLNGRSRFTRDDLAWFERISRHIGPSLENVFLLRHLRARAIEAERSRISRDLHDGILQTLLSVEIQLDVLRRAVVATPEQGAAALANLQQTVKNESAELRRMVTDMRPVRVQSADLVDLMIGFAERYRNESNLALDVLIDSVEVQAPDRVCRELFQIYREALNNIKKHAKASHVVVKLSQDDSSLVLVVDDNGEGFSFAGRFTGDELDRLRLGPISIKERTRTVGGVLTVESNPGHGARLTIEIPLG
ncbi:MAG TPA: sensor histidine kinase [Candidatus Eisenbacteria bacterium]|jgi:signal transduction histidine kinase|nr:sensor histidine kinase [Candidatus Eisenbacteria bacterium]